MLRSQDSSDVFVPSRTIEVKPESQIDYNPRTSNQIKFHIPAYLGFIDPRYTTLDYKLEMQGQGKPIPGRAGVHSLFRDLRIQDGMGSVELESVQDYNVLSAQMWPYSDNKTIRHKRELMEGLQVGPGADRNMFWSYEGDWSSGAITEPGSAKVLDIKQPLHSGILGSDKVWPLVATDGLRLTLTLDNVARSCRFGAGELGCQDRYLTSVTAKVIGDDAKVAIGDTFDMVVNTPADAANGEGVYGKGQGVTYDNNPYTFGDVLYVSDAAGGANEEVLGVVYGFDNDTFGRLLLKYIPARPLAGGLVANHAAGSRIFVKSANRLNGTSLADLPADVITEIAKPMTYTISDLRLVCQTVSPPAAYVKALESQMKSSKGLAIDYKEWSLQRFNLPQQDGLTNQLIPTRETRAYSIVSVPLDQARQSNPEFDSLVGIPDGAVDYTYVYGSTLIPDRPVSVAKYSSAVPKVEPLHLVEVEKALSNVGLDVRDLQRVPEKFIIARSFSRYGQVSNLSDHDLSLRVEYSGSAKVKLFEHFICGLRRMIVSSEGIRVE